MFAYVILSAPRVCPPDYTPATIDYVNANNAAEAIRRAELPAGAHIRADGTARTNTREFVAVRAEAI